MGEGAKRQGRVATARGARLEQRGEEQRGAAATAAARATTPKDACAQHNGGAGEARNDAEVGARQRGRSGKGGSRVKRAVADATVLGKYVQLVARPQAAARQQARRAAQWYARWRAARRSAETSGSSTGSSGAAAVQRRSAAAAAPSNEGRRDDDNKIVNNKVAAINTPVGKKRSLFIGLNVVAALQRNECVGRSWRSVWGDG